MFADSLKMSMVSSRGMFVKSESITKLPMMEFFSIISEAMLNESLIVSLLVVNVSKTGTKYSASLYAGVCKVDKIGLKDGQPSTYVLYISQVPYIIPGLVSTGFRCLRVSSNMLLKSTPINESKRTFRLCVSV